MTIVNTQIEWAHWLNFSETYHALIRSVTWLPYWRLSFIRRYFGSVYPAFWPRKAMLFGRYYPNKTTTPFCHRIMLSRQLKVLLSRLIPVSRPTFVIRVDQEDVHRRQQELTLEQIVEPNGHYKKLVRRGWLIVLDKSGASENEAAVIVDRYDAELLKRVCCGLQQRSREK